MRVTGEMIEAARKRAKGSVLNILRLFPEAVPDVLQEACIQAFVKRRQFRGDAKFTTWFHRIAVNKALEYRRRQRAIHGVNDGNCVPLEQYQENEDGSDYDWLPPADVLNPEEIVLQRERTQLLAQKLLKLRPTMRHAILRYALTERGTGSAGYNSSTEKARRHRGFNDLRKVIGELAR